MPRLTVPIKIHTAFAEKDKIVVGPEMDFEDLPYFDEELGRDVNGTTPYLAESIVSRPFSDGEFVLRAGIHLNWEFPQFLKSTKVGSSDPSDFPAVPTRWLVRRYRNNSITPDQEWIIESDALFVGHWNPDYTSNLAQVSLPFEIDAKGNPIIDNGKKPFAYLGLVSTLDVWKDRAGNDSPYSTWKKEFHDKNKKSLPLTALGWGSLSFDNFYPNCQGSFGFHDSEITTAEKGLRYEIIGWYADEEDDYWKQYLDLEYRKTAFASIIEALNQATHLSKVQRQEHAQKALQKMIQDDLALEISEEEIKKMMNEDGLSISQDQAGMLCTGSVAAFAKSWSQDKEQPYVAVGSTPLEALAALVIEQSESSKKLSPPLRHKLEDSLNAILMGDRLKGAKLDVGAKFRETEHRDHFRAQDGGLYWTIAAIQNPELENGNNLPQGENAPQRIKPELTPELKQLLDQLNLAQTGYDKVRFELEDRRTQLYADWCRYMYCCYPPPGETQEYIEIDELVATIEKTSLGLFQETQKTLGTLSFMQAEKGKLVLEKPKNGKTQTLADQVWMVHNGLLKAIATANDALKNKKDETPSVIAEHLWELQHRPAPRFWEPQPPAVVLAFPNKGEFVETKKSLAIGSFTAQNINLDPAGFNLPTSGIITTTQTGSEGIQLFNLEWEAEVFAVRKSGPTGDPDGAFQPDFIKANYFLGENEPDLEDNIAGEGFPTVNPVGNRYHGRTMANLRLQEQAKTQLQQFLTSTAATAENKNKLGGFQAPKFALTSPMEKQELQQAMNTVKQATDAISDFSNLINKLLREQDGVTSFQANSNEDNLWFLREHLKLVVEKAVLFLESRTLITLTLDGFNTALLQRHQSLQLQAADPLGFADYQKFATEVRKALQGAQSLSPNPHHHFMPIRAGGLFLHRLRLVDHFGRFHDVRPTEVYTAQDKRIRNQSAWVELLPRLSQPARIDFRFVTDAALTITQTQAPLLESPVAGWIVPNLFNQSLAFFAANGDLLGEVNQNLEWKAWQNRPLTGHLEQIKKWLVEKKTLPSFLRNIEEAMDNIHPYEGSNQSMFSVLMGRPMAVVQLSADLVLRGLPASDLDWNSFGYKDGRRKIDTHQFEHVQWLYRLGEYIQRNDGLVGYWPLSNGQLAAEFYVNDAVSATIQSSNIPTDEAAIDNLPLELRVANEDWKLHDEQERTLIEWLRDEATGENADNTIKRQDLIQRYVRHGSAIWAMMVKLGWLVEEPLGDHIQHYAETSHLQMSVADEPQRFLALMDPFGAVHLSSGLQPVKALRLLEEWVQPALQRMEFHFPVAPLLGPEESEQPQELEVSLPRQQGYVWQWQAGGATAPDANMEMAPFHRTARFPKRNILREGTLVLRPEEDKKETKK